LTTLTAPYGDEWPDDDSGELFDVTRTCEGDGFHLS
jgi:hypothetical protein